MLQSRVGRTAYTFAKIRAKWLGYLAAFTLGFHVCAAWVFVIHYAPGVAIGLIAKSGMF